MKRLLIFSIRGGTDEPGAAAKTGKDLLLK
jgi:hypothetical protein